MQYVSRYALQSHDNEKNRYATAPLTTDPIKSVKTSRLTHDMFAYQRRSMNNTKQFCCNLYLLTGNLCEMQICDGKRTSWRGLELGVM